MSVYNVLWLKEVSLMPIAELLPYLHEHFNPKYPAAWVTDGVAWLVEKGFAVSNGIIIQIRHLNSRGKPLRITKTPDETGLQLVTKC